MATIKDIAKALVERHKMKAGVSEEFLQAMVGVINEGLLQDRIVKIKGFGTFKLQEVKERKSVNVNTGESVVIAAHDRITFTPDSVMRDLVNKPFAQFETVVVENTDVKPVFESEPKTELEPELEKEDVKVEEQKKEELKAEVVAPEPEPEAKPEPEVKKEVKTKQEVKEEPKEEKEEKQRKPFLYVAIGIVIAVLCFALGYFASHNDLFKKSGTPAPEGQGIQKVDSVPFVATDTIPASTPKKAETPETDMDKYNKDARVRYGAYVIIGTETEVTVRKGQTLKGISKAYLGPDMECYVEAYNNTKEVKEGDKVLIPKLQVKKRKK